MLPSELSSSGVDVWGKQRNNSNNIITSDSQIYLLYQTIKSKQIAQLHLVPFRVIELEKDFEYQIIINEIPEFSLYVSFPPLFPQENAQFKVSKPLNHPWISDGVLIDRCPLINNSTNISHIVKELADELLRVRMPMNVQSTALAKTLMKPIINTTQPILSTHSTFHSANNFLMTTAPHQMKSLTNPISGSFHDSFSSPFQSSDSSSILMNYGGPFAHGLKVTSSMQNIDKVRITSVQDLDKLSTEEITLTLNDPERLEELLMSCHGNQVEMFRMKRKEFNKQVEDLAHSNLTKSAAFEEMKAHLLKKHQEHQEIINKLESSSKQLEEKIKATPDSEMLFDSMRVIAMEAEERSDAIAKSFTEGQTNIEVFLKAFQEQRKLFHVRSIKCHKFSEHLCYGVPL